MRASFIRFRRAPCNNRRYPAARAHDRPPPALSSSRTRPAGVLLGLLVMWLAADVLLHVDELAGHVGAGLREVGAARLPGAPHPLPLACLAGAVLCLSRALRNRELTAIRTGGIRLQAALAPLLGAVRAGRAGHGRLRGPGAPAARTRRSSAAERGRRRQGVRAPERLLSAGGSRPASSIFSAADYDSDDARAARRDRVPVRRAARRSASGSTRRAPRAWTATPGRSATRTCSSSRPRAASRATTSPALRLDLGISGREMSRAAEPAAVRVAARPRAPDPQERRRRGRAREARARLPQPARAAVRGADLRAARDSVRDRRVDAATRCRARSCARCSRRRRSGSAGPLALLAARSRRRAAAAARSGASRSRRSRSATCAIRAIQE